MTLLLRRLAGLGRLLGASLGLLLLVAGVPLGLVFGVGFPRSLPSWSDIVNQLQTQGIPTAALLYLLALVCWVLWAYLIWCLVTEAVSLVRRSSGRHRAITGPGRLLAGALLASLFVGVQLMSSRAVPPPAVTPLAAGLAPRTSVTAVYHPASPAPTTLGPGASLLSSSPSPPADQEVQVQPGDSLWAIAGREYGNPQEWPAIWGANQGQTEDNGQPFTDPSIIDPGWELEVPNPLPPAPTAPPAETPASGSADTSPAASSPPALNTEQQVEVQPGDSLWAISGREYGNPQEWPRIWEADQGQTEDNGQTFTDPSLIDPGWELAVPALEAPSTTPSAPATAPPPTPAQAVAPGSGAAPHDIGVALPSLAPSLAPVAPSVPAGGAPASPPTSAPLPTGHTPAVRAPASADSWVVTLAEAGVLAGITAAALGGLLLAAQRYERWRRRPGDPGGSRVAVLARRPSVARIRAALATATASAQDGSVPSAPVIALQARLEAIEAVPGRLVVGRRAGDDGDAIVDIDELHRVELTGPGAEGAARAILVSFLAHHGIENGQVLVATSADVALIAPADGPPGLHLLAAAQVLDQLESEIRYQRGALDGEGFTNW
jgi:nucleoid-associated protein YgaU